MRKYVFLFFALNICLSVVYAQSPEEIMHKSRDIMKLNSFEAYSTLKIRDNRGNERIRKSTMASKSYSDGSEKRVIRFTGPPEVAGTGILIFDYKDKSDDMWIYLPAMRQTRRIVSSEKSKSFMGSEFSNSDMTAPAIIDFSYRDAGEADIDGHACRKIESIPRTAALADEYGYSRAINYVNKEDFVVLLSEFYNYDNELVKKIKTDNYQLVDKENGKYMVTEMTSSNLANGRSSVMIMDKIQLAQTDDKYFTVTWLEKNQ